MTTSCMMRNNLKMLLEISWFREQEYRGQECFKTCSGIVKMCEALFDHGTQWLEIVMCCCAIVCAHVPH